LIKSRFPKTPFFEDRMVFIVPVNDIAYPEEAYPCYIECNHIKPFHHYEFEGCSGDDA